MKERNLIEESTYDGIFYFGTWIEKLRLRELDKSGKLSDGLNYLKVFERCILECQEDTSEAVREAEDHLQALGITISLLDRVASCFWGYSRGDHILEYIVGRVVGYSQSALFLANSGLYDEALLLIRSITEIANLFALFVADPAVYSDWKTFSESQRISEFGPGKVRKKLALLNASIPYDRNQYGWLCEVAAHVTPHTKPQVHQPKTRPSAGATFQQDGFNRVLKEISLAVALVSEGVAQLADIEECNRTEIEKYKTILLSFT